MFTFVNPHTATAFATGVGRKQKQPVRKDKGYISWLHELPCVITGRTGEGVQAAHIRYGDIAYAKPQAGRGEKPDDVWCLPLWHECHAEQHSMNENEYWEGVGLPDPLAICTRLYAVYPSIERAELIIQNLPRGFQKKVKT